MRSKFDHQLQTLNNMLIEMGTQIETAIARSIQALKNQDIKLAELAISSDAEVNQQEKDIEALCLKLLLQQQPVASDLRLISSALKMITDMERIGDQAADIAEISIFLAEQPSIIKLDRITQMATAAAGMVTDSIDAFVKKDLELARQVVMDDDKVDNLFNAIKDELIALISEDSSKGSQAIDLMMVAKYLERIGDHAVNIAEWVIFSITGSHNEGSNIKVIK